MTVVTVRDTDEGESVTPSTPSNIKDNSNSVTETQGNPPALLSVLSEEDQAIYFLRYLLTNCGGVGEHREVSMRCSNVDKQGRQNGLSGDDILRIIPGLIDRGILEITTTTRKGGPKSYSVTEHGVEEYNRMIADPNQISLFDL